MNWTHEFEIEDDNELEEQSKEDDGTAAVIFLIDCGKLLFENDETTNKRWFDTIISSCLSVIKNKAMTAHKDHISVIFYRVRNHTDEMMKNVYVYQTLEQPGIDEIKKIMALQHTSMQNFDKDYGFSDNLSLFLALWSCQAQFSKTKKTFGSKQIILFTFDDDPSLTNIDNKGHLQSKLKDLKQSNIDLTIIPVANQTFDVDKLFQVLLESKLSDNFDDSISISTLEQLATRTRQKRHTKRTTARVSWILGNNLSINVGVYSLVSKTPPLSSVPLDRMTNNDVSKKNELSNDNGRLLMPSDLKYAVKISGRNIIFEKEELIKLRSVYEPGIRLIGFKPLKYLKTYYQIRTPQFMYPDEQTVEGNIKLFTALLWRCLERKLFALCVYVPRKSAQVRVVALVPQMEKLNSSKLQVQPSGFSIIYLPFKEDIRDLDLPLCHVQDKGCTGKEKSQKLIEALSVEYDPFTILNPALQKQWTYVETLALDLEKPDKTDDNTVIDTDEINEHCGEFLEEYRDFFHLDFQTSGPVKTAKLKQDVNLEELFKSKKLETLTIPQLKLEASALRIKITGSKKADIIKSICTYFESIN